MYETKLLVNVKQILNIDNCDSDSFLTILIDASIKKIRTYLNINIKDMYEDENQTEIKEEYCTAIILATIDSYNYHIESKTTKGIRTMTQGQRSITYDTSDIKGLSEDVKSVLPLPKIRLI